MVSWTQTVNQSNSGVDDYLFKRIVRTRTCTAETTAALRGHATLNSFHVKLVSYRIVCRVKLTVIYSNRPSKFISSKRVPVDRGLCSQEKADGGRAERSDGRRS